MQKVLTRLTIPVLLILMATGCGGKKKETKEGSKTEPGKAKVGVGAKGKGYGNALPLLKPAATFWKAKEALAFNAVIPKNMQLFEATNGRKPKSHEEFMQKIIRDGKVSLPDLDEGLEYFYDAKKGELMVRNSTDPNTNSN